MSELIASVCHILQVAVVDESGTVYLTPAMEQRIQFSGDVEAVIIEVSTKK